MCLAGLGVGAGDFVRVAGETVGRGGVGAALGGVGVGTAPAPICGTGLGASPAVGGIGTGTGPSAGPIGGVGPPELGTGMERFELPTVAAGIGCRTAAPPSFVSARTEMGTTAKAIPNTIATSGPAGRSAVLRWPASLRAVISARVAIEAPRPYHIPLTAERPRRFPPPTHERAAGKLAVVSAFSLPASTMHQQSDKSITLR